MSPVRLRPDPSSVFLNVPFDTLYERLFVALIATVVATGRAPRLVAEVSETGAGRLSRLVDLMSECAVSIHDLSRVGLPVRFNMPFELGLCCALQHIDNRYMFMILEARSFRLDRTLSDAKGRDTLIHDRKPGVLIRKLLMALKSSGSRTSYEDVVTLDKGLLKAARKLQAAHPDARLYDGYLFQQLVVAATQLAQKQGLLT